jgi:hypothetical protein
MTLSFYRQKLLEENLEKTGTKQEAAFGIAGLIFLQLITRRIIAYHAA